MCNNPEMLRLLRDEIREEMAARRARRAAAPERDTHVTGWRPAALAVALPAIALAALAALYL